MYTYDISSGINMAKIRRPRRDLLSIWRAAGNSKTFPDITRAYHRLNGKFIPIGWYLDDRQGTTILVTDQEVSEYFTS